MSVNNEAVKIMAAQIKKSWGAGWNRITTQQQIETVSFYVMGSVMNSGVETVSVAKIREMFEATKAAAGIKEQDIDGN